MHVKIQKNEYIITVHGTSSFAVTDRHKLPPISQQRTEISVLTQERRRGKKIHSEELHHVRIHKY
jgi:hypothetical protein